MEIHNTLKFSIKYENIEINKEFCLDDLKQDWISKMMIGNTISFEEFILEKLKLPLRNIFK